MALAFLLEFVDSAGFVGFGWFVELAGLVGFDWFVGLAGFAEFAEGVSLFKGCSIRVPILNRMADISAGINLVTAESSI